MSLDLPLCENWFNTIRTEAEIEMTIYELVISFIYLQVTTCNTVWIKELEL